jgi:hypothetical protein
MRAFHDRRSRNSGESVRFTVAAVVCAGVVFCGVQLMTGWLLENPGEAEESAGRSSPRRAERIVQNRIDAFIARHGRNPKDLHEVKENLVAKLHERLPNYVDVEYDPEKGTIKVFEIDPFVPGPTEHSVFGAADPPDERARFFEATLRDCLEEYGERHGRYPENIRDCAVVRKERSFRLPVGYRIEYFPATGRADVVPE